MNSCRFPASIALVSSTMVEATDFTVSAFIVTLRSQHIILQYHDRPLLVAVAGKRLRLVQVPRDERLVAMRKEFGSLSGATLACVNGADHVDLIGTFAVAVSVAMRSRI